MNLAFTQNQNCFFSPGRINLIGEHIDYNDGFVMPAAIDKGIWFAVAENGTDDINIFSADMEEWLKTDVNKINKSDGWKNYLLGVIDVLQKKNFKIKGFNCVFGGNIPVGAGLSSSAAVECGLGMALSDLFQLNIDRVDIALIGQKAEHTFVGVQCGIMDQFANMMGENEKVLLLDCNSLKYEALDLRLKNYELVLINSKVHHSLASGEYNVRRQQSEDGLKILKDIFPNAKSFRDIKPSDVVLNEDKFSEKVFDRCLFVTQEIERTQNAAQLLKLNDLKTFGSLMFQAHEGLSKLYEVSCEELDFLVDEAKKFSSIIGSRMMGGGFGGCTINLMEKENADVTIEKITSAYKDHFDIEAEVYRVKLSDGTHEISL